MNNTVKKSKSITGGTNLSTTKHVSIVLHGAKNLKSVGQATTDPYVVFSIGNESVKSTCTEKTLSPNFQDQKFLVLVRTGEEDLQIRCFDWDQFTRDDLMGATSIWLKMLPMNMPVRKWFPLDEKKGEIEMTVTAVNFGLSPEEYQKTKSDIVVPERKHYEVNTSLGENGAKQAKLADSNVANIGSSQDLAQRVAAAKKANEWKGAGVKEGLQIWRIENFNIVPVSVGTYGQFYNGDSYIVLNTYKNKSTNKLQWDVHYWLGSTSSQDEQGVAAYKTVELDDLLGGAPVQHREVQGAESKLFLSYFSTFLILDGGVDSGFKHVEAEKYEPKLLHVKGKTTVHVKEVPLSGDSLNHGDVFILDAGLTLYYWAGTSSSPKEKFKGQCVLATIKSQRSGRSKEIRLPVEGSEEFWQILGGQPATIRSAEEGGDDEIVSQQTTSTKVYKLSDASGILTFELIADGKVTKGILQSGTADVLIIDVGSKLFVSVGSQASKDEKNNAMLYAEKYLRDHNRSTVCITRTLDVTSLYYLTAE